MYKQNLRREEDRVKLSSLGEKKSDSKLYQSINSFKAIIM